MNGRERLRAYLEQRREMGESEFVLDNMSVEDALGAIDKLQRSTLRATPRVQPSAPPVRTASDSDANVKAASKPRPPANADSVAEQKTAKVSKAPPEPSAPPSPSGARYSFPTNDQTPGHGATASSTLREGLVVGGAASSLFEKDPFRDVDSLTQLATLIAECTRCPLHRTAKNPVPGDGDPNADFMCVGEAPGANEDETGHPFVGQAGALLTKILAAINLSRDDVYITNVLKHRPPSNRNPLPDEVLACSPYLVRQIQMVRPKVILALGTFASQTLLNTKTPIGKLRGAVHRYYGIPLIVTYHPAALLRNPAWKRPTWEDVKLARLVLDTAKQ